MGAMGGMALVEQYKGIIEANGGKVGRIESWGLR
ncbi:30S ribosomal protein S6, partial [Phyllobacterium sp. 22229]